MQALPRELYLKASWYYTYPSQPPREEVQWDWQLDLVSKVWAMKIIEADTSLDLASTSHHQYG